MQKVSGGMKIGDEVYIHGYVDEIRKDTIIVKNEGGYFGTIPSEITDREQEHCEDCLFKNEWQKIGKLISVILEKQKEQKTGHWVYTGDYITDGMLKCSQCGFEHDVSERFLYCPNCGAKMEREE